jgi:transcriptional regulator with XRE-family HTH domain
MEFNEKLQQLRKQKGLTQEELAGALYISRTAISKWESGRGYPSLESLKAIAKFFSVTVDELLSGNELLSAAEEDNRQKTNRLRDLLFGLLDLSMALLLFLPLFREREGGVLKSSSLLALDTVQPYLGASYLAVIIGMILTGILTLALQNFQAEIWIKSKTKISFLFSTVSVLLFVISLQPYAAVFALVLFAIKGLIFAKR